MAQKTRFIGVKLHQPQAQPVQPVPHQRQVGRSLNGDHLIKPVFTQTHDGLLQSVQRPREPHAKEQRHCHGQGNRPDDLLRQMPLAVVKPGFE